jgi:hypothetical protein
MKQGQCQVIARFETIARFPQPRFKGYSAQGLATKTPRTSRLVQVRSPLGLLRQLAITAWFILFLPIRFVALVLGFVGRLAGVILGFGLIVLGMALCTGPLFIFGIPVLIIGLLLLLRCLH